MVRRQYLDRLSEVPLFAQCSKKELQSVSRASTEVEFPAGETLMVEGKLGREAFVLVDGTVTVRRNDREVAELGPGSVVGELALCNPEMRTRTATVEAVTDVHALVFTPGEFLALLTEVPSIAKKVVAALAGRVGELDRKAYG